MTDAPKKNRARGASPTRRSLSEARELGFKAEVVERFNRFSNRTTDLFNCIDVIAMKAGVGILGIQATSRDNHAARRKKALAEPLIREWIESGGRFEVWSWGKMAKAVNRRRWQVWREELRADDLTTDPSGEFPEAEQSLGERGGNVPKET